MFDYPYDNTTNYSYRAMQAHSSISIFHAAPNAPAVDIYANGDLIVKNLAYKKLSKHLIVSPGNYNIKVYPSGQTANPVIDTNISIPEDSAFNIAAIGNLPSISLYTIPEPITAENSGSCVRFVHLSPNAPAVDIKLSNGTSMFTNVNYKDITNYVCVPTGTYTFKASPTGTDNAVLTVSNVKLNPYSHYTIYAIGLVGESPALEAVIVSDLR